MKRREDDVNKKLYQLTLNRLKEQGIDIDLNIIESVCKAKWEFLTYIIRFGQKESYRDKYLGNFGVKRWRPATKAYRTMSKEDKAIADAIPDSLDKFKYLDKKYQEYYNTIKIKENRLYFPVIMTDKKGKETEFNTLEEAAKATKLEPIHIYISCLKSTKTKRGLKFRFKIVNGDKEKEEPRNT